ncbi:MAG TPA: hypothetical protein VE090_06165 [Methylomirabilota bacterium]|nr:hypothetical protein [Methylomirabilota bacterium]
MYNWSVDIKKLSKYPEKYTIWKLEQLINFGLNNERLNRKELDKYLERLTIDPQKKKYLQFLMS